MIRWHSITNVDFEREQMRKMLTEALARLPEGVKLVARFDALGHSPQEHEAAA